MGNRSDSGQQERQGRCGYIGDAHPARKAFQLGSYGIERLILDLRASGHNEHVLRRGMQLERELQRLAVRNGDRYSGDAAAHVARGLVRGCRREEDDRCIGKQLSAVVQDESQGRIGHRDDHVYRAALKLPSQVVLESQRRCFGGEEIGLEVLGVIVNGYVGARRQPIANARVQQWIAWKTLGTRVDGQYGPWRCDLCVG